MHTLMPNPEKTLDRSRHRVPKVMVMIIARALYGIKRYVAEWRAKLA